MSTKYPYKAWMLSSSFIPREVLIVDKGWGTNYEKLDSGAHISRGKLLSTRKAAIDAGKKDLEQRRARLAKSKANIEKHAANLDKAEAGNG